MSYYIQGAVVPLQIACVQIACPRAAALPLRSASPHALMRFLLVPGSLGTVSPHLLLEGKTVLHLPEHLWCVMWPDIGQALVVQRFLSEWTSILVSAQVVGATEGHLTKCVTSGRWAIVLA